VKKTWLIARHEYARHVFRRRFLFSLFSLPAFFVVTAAILTLTISSERVQPVGLVDLSGQSDPKLCTEFSCLTTETQAELALQERQIQGYFVLDSETPQSGRARLVTVDPISSNYESLLSNWLRQRILQELPASIAWRLQNGNNLVVQSADGTRQFHTGDWLSLLLPIMLIFVFLMAIFSTSGYLMQAVAEEKENSTIEMILTSTSTIQMIAGKVIGSLGIGLTQIITWVGMIVFGIALGVHLYGFRGELNVSPGAIAMAVVSLLLAFITLAALMAAVGAVVAEATEGQQITGPFSLPFLVPFFFLAAILNEPHSTLAVGLSLAPLTAPVAMTLRLALVEVPAWQIGLSQLLQVLVALSSLWLAGRFFRLGMLRYGQSVGTGWLSQSWKQIFRRSGT
jgi:ABC-2 type transport system permease protein